MFQLRSQNFGTFFGMLQQMNTLTRIAMGLQCCIVLLTLGSAAFAQDAKKYALLFGVSKYETASMNQPQPLEFPEADAKAIAQVLADSGYKCVVVVGREATRDRIRSELAKLKSEGNDEGAVLVAFFGHGVEYEVPGKGSATESYFCPFDVDLRFAKDKQGRSLMSDDGKSKLTEPDPDKAIGMTEVFDALRLSKAGRRIVIADCCRNDPNAARGRSFGANVNVSDLPERTAALFACSRGEKAFEDNDNGHGAFTYALLNRIKNHSGAALTAAALGEHLEDAVSKRVKKMTNGRQSQTPRYLSVSKVDLLLKANKKDSETTQDVTYRPEESYFAPSLYPGMKAPPLGKLKFIEGEAVEEFKPGTIYVINTFASWCAPCVNAIPKLSALQRNFPEVVFIEVDMDGQEDAEEFLKNEKHVDKVFSKDKKIGYRFATTPTKWSSEDHEFSRNWMVPSASDGIPTVFVIDKRSRIAWIGHPNDLEKNEIVKQLSKGELNLSEVRRQYLESRIAERLNNYPAIESEAKFLSTLELCHPTHEAGRFAAGFGLSDWQGKLQSLKWSSATRNRLKSLAEEFVRKNRDDMKASEVRQWSMIVASLYGTKDRALAEFEKWSELMKAEYATGSEEEKEKLPKYLERVKERLNEVLDLR
jgi:thiol-disulfide isomerase/thioredoxin